MVSLGDTKKVVIVGGAAYVGLPFELVLADNGYKVTAMATSHSVYRTLSFSQPVVDVWNLYGDGVLI